MAKKDPVTEPDMEPDTGETADTEMPAKSEVSENNESDIEPDFEDLEEALASETLEDIDEEFEGGDDFEDTPEHEAPAIEVVGDVTGRSVRVVRVDSVEGIFEGMKVAGAPFASGTRVVRVDSDRSFVISDGALRDGSKTAIRVS